MNIEHAELIRKTVINVVEQDMEGSSEFRIPALFLYGTAQEIHDNLGPHMIAKLEVIGEMFLLGFGIGATGSL